MTTDGHLPRTSAALAALAALALLAAPRPAAAQSKSDAFAGKIPPVAGALYQTIITQHWVSELSHAAYLGKELARAELALQHGFKYVQDGA